MVANKLSVSFLFLKKPCKFRVYLAILETKIRKDKRKKTYAINICTLTWDNKKFRAQLLIVFNQNSCIDQRFLVKKPVWFNLN
jgi:hypothetical protein